MSQKVVLITGASSDIGSAIAMEMLNSHYKVAAQYLRNYKPIEKLKTEAQKNKLDFKPLSFDLSKADNCHKMVNEVIKSYKKIDILINTIGPFLYKNILEITPTQWSEDININLNIAFNLIYYAREYICSSRGHIINFTFSGIENLKSWDMSAGYCSAKAGIYILTKSLAKALAPMGVRVNSIAPGVIDEKSTDWKERQKKAETIPLKRLGKPEEIFKVVKWLIEESPDYITGANIPVAGGWEY